MRNATFFILVLCPGSKSFQNENSRKYYCVVITEREDYFYKNSFTKLLYWNCSENQIRCYKCVDWNCLTLLFGGIND